MAAIDHREPPEVEPVGADAARAGTDRGTPLGGIDGEFCPLDRALIFEDPNGTRILYDPGRTVAGGDGIVFDA